jgi:hypothetical protein
MPYKNKEDLYKKQQETRDRNSEMVWDLLSKSKCVDCGISDARVLQYDHLPESDKKFSVSRACSGMTISWKRIQEEIDKCEVVCANCHQIRTAERGNFIRHRLHKKNSVGSTP